MEIRLLKCPEDNSVIKKLINNMDNAQLLVPDVCTKMVERVCVESIYYGFNSVVCTPNTVERTAQLLKGSPVHTLFGFGDAGRGCIEGKIETLKKVLKYEVQEVDMIMNMPRFFDGQFDVVQSDISTLAKMCGERGAELKVIIECGLLTDEQKRKAVELSIAGGAKYIKTASGGPGTGTINMHNILLLKKAIAGRAKLKASSGVQTLEDAWAFMEAGADRTAGRDNIITQLKALGYTPQ